MTSVAQHSIPRVSRWAALATALFVFAGLFVGGISPSDSAVASTAPTVVSLSPAVGTVAGGTTVTVTGSGFFGSGGSGDVSGVTIGGQAATSVSVVSDTELSVVTPARSKGAQAVVVTTGTGGASSSSIFFNYFDIMVANSDRIVGFETRAERFEMGELASRTRQRPFSAIQSAGGGLFRVFGVDSNTGQPYSFLTDQSYSLNSGGGNEGFEGGYVASAVSGFNSSVSSTTSEGRQPITLRAPYGFSCSNISSSSTAIPVAFRNSQARFCSVFGPEIWSNAFYAETGEALSFQYSANSSDEYEPYGFLVKVRDLGGGKFSYGSAVGDDPERAESVSVLSTHSIVLYARGRNTSSQGGYVTASGNVPETGHYRFRFVNGSFDGTGGSVLGADFSIDAASISVARAHSITFPSPGDQVGASGTFDISVTSSAGLPVNLSTTTSSVCDFATTGALATSLSNVTSGSTVPVRKSSAGTCTILANAPAGVGADTRTYVAAELTSRTFQIRASAVAPSNVLPPSISGTASTGETLIAALGDWSDGGDPITGTTYQWKRTKSGTTVNITGATAPTLCLADDPDIIGSTISVTVTRTNPRGSSAPTNSTATAAVAQVGACTAPSPPATASPAGSPSPVVVPTLVTPPRVLPRVLPTPPPVVGPVVSATTATPPSAPTALVGGRSVVISTQVTNPNTMSLRAGVLNIGMNVSSDQGSVSSQGGSTELQVRNGGSAGLTGSGLLPRSTVQVFMPLGGSNSREIARIPVDATGSFSGDALFGATPSEAPLPIGRHVLQMVTVDENRQQTVVEMTVNIAQPPPAPELNRSTNERPALLPGQSIATNGGQPEAVTVTPIPDQKQATIQGDGWSMAVGVEGENGGVSSGEGGAVVTFVRDQGALVSGEGFMPGTRADVWLFSDPTLLGTVDIDENGEFNGTVNIDGNVVTVGEHTLQLQGVGEDGYVRSANLGVTVADEAPALTEETSGSFLWLLLVALGVIALAAGGTWWSRRTVR